MLFAADGRSHATKACPSRGGMHGMIPQLNSTSWPINSSQFGRVFNLSYSEPTIVREQILSLLRFSTEFVLDM